jgi:hypothetical protein
MRKPLHLVAVAALLVASFAAAPGVLAQTAMLDGRAFVADAGPKGKAADEKGDLITFADGQFHSKMCDQYGYGKGAYKATKVGDTIEWEAVTTSEKDGKNVWKGTIRGSDIEGTLMHHPKGWFLNPDPSPEEIWFKGKARS